VIAAFGLRATAAPLRADTPSSAICPVDPGGHRSPPEGHSCDHLATALGQVEGPQHLGRECITGRAATLRPEVTCQVTARPGSGQGVSRVAAAPGVRPGRVGPVVGREAVNCSARRTRKLAMTSRSPGPGRVRPMSLFVTSVTTWFLHVAPASAWAWWKTAVRRTPDPLRSGRGRPRRCRDHIRWKEVRTGEAEVTPPRTFPHLEAEHPAVDARPSPRGPGRNAGHRRRV
jgi:hypothetical protein